MAMNDDLKVNFDKLNKACKQANEEWENMMKENNPFDTISKIAKDIADRQDREKALKFAKCIGKLFRENGVTAIIQEYRTGGTLKDKNLIEEYYGVAITGLDFTEHDKKFKDEITQLKHDLEKTYNQLKETEKEAQERISELENKLNESKYENTENYIEYNQTTNRTYGILFQKYKGKSKNDVILNFSTFINKLEENGIKVYDTEKGFDIETDDNLCGNLDELPTAPIEVAQMLINSTYEYESSDLEKALFKCGETRTTERYSIDDLEQIAEHLLVYCKHHREDEG